jgi:hypothetical protein
MGELAWQGIAHWVWNLRLELGHHLKPEPLRTTEFAPARDEANAEQAEQTGYEPPVIAGAWKAGHYTGTDFALQPDGTVRCPQGKSLFPQERRREDNGSLRIVYEARIADCRACPVRPHCQWHGKQAQHPRRVSLLLHPRLGGSAPLLWCDWPRREQRRACIQVLHRQQVNVVACPPPSVQPLPRPAVLSRAQRAHYRLSWEERLARNAQVPAPVLTTLTLYGIPDSFAAFLGLPRT